MQNDLQSNRSLPHLSRGKFHNIILGNASLWQLSYLAKLSQTPLRYSNQPDFALLGLLGKYDRCNVGRYSNYEITLLQYWASICSPQHFLTLLAPALGRQSRQRTTKRERVLWEKTVSSPIHQEWPVDNVRSTCCAKNIPLPLGFILCFVQKNLNAT